MDVSRRFQEVLENVENSNLNYTISKTPFSAHISIKRSFIRFYDQALPQKTKYPENVNETSNFELNEKLVNAEDQNEKLKDLLQYEQVKVLGKKKKRKKSGLIGSL